VPKGLTRDFWPQNKVKKGTGYFLKEKRKIAGCWSDRSMLRFTEANGDLNQVWSIFFLALASWQLDQKSEKGVFRRGHQKAGTAGFTPHTMIDAAGLAMNEIAGI
jgi:hypothetical protein